MSESQQNMIMKDQHVVNLFKHSLIPVSGSRSICKNRIHKEERMVEFRVSWMMDDWFRFRPIPILWLMWIDRFLNLNSSKTLHQSKGPFSSYQSCKIHSFSTTSVARNSSSMPQYKRVWFSNLDMHFGKQFEMQEDCKHEILIYANILWWLSGVGILSRKIGSSFWCGSGLPLTCELEVLSISEFCFCIYTHNEQFVGMMQTDGLIWIPLFLNLARLIYLWILLLYTHTPSNLLEWCKRMDMNSSVSQSCKIDPSLNVASVYIHTLAYLDQSSIHSWTATQGRTMIDSILTNVLFFECTTHYQARIRCS